MRTVCVWVLTLAVLGTGCESQGSVPHAGDPSEVDLDLGELTIRAAAVPQVGSYPDLTRKLASVPESIERARTTLRQDSATSAADSAYVRFRRELRDRVRGVVAEFNDREFQADVWPAGAAAMVRSREDSRQERRPPPEEDARADSLVAVFTANGIWVYHAEGSTYFAPDEAVLLTRLGPYLTHGTRAFLAMQVDEQRQPVGEDAALMIPLDELTRRILWAERYLELYPHSVVADVVQSRYGWYMAIYLGGLPNTPAFDWQTHAMRPQWRESMEQYASRYGSAPSGQLVSRYLGMLVVSDFKRTAEINAYLSELWENVRLVHFP